MKLALFTIALAALAAANKLVIAGFGDSYAAGRALKESIGQRLRRRLKEEHGKDYDFVNLADEEVWLDEIPELQAPQMKGRVPAVVYMIAGAEELAYIECLNWYFAPRCSENVTESDWVQLYQMVLDTLVEISGFDEDIPIYLFEYIQAVDERMRCNPSHTLCPWNEKQYKNILDSYQYLNDWMTTALREWKLDHDNSKFKKVKIVPMRELGLDHHLMSLQPWIHSGLEILTNQDYEELDGYVWHPNQAGTNAMADYILEDMFG